MIEHRTGRHAARPSPPDPRGHPVAPARTIGFVELYGRLIAAANHSADGFPNAHEDHEDGPAEPPTPAPAGDLPAGPHQRVFGDLSPSDGDGDAVGPDLGGASRLYRAADVPLTAKAALLADLIPLAATGPGIYTAAARDAARGLAGMPTAQADRQVGDIAVLASLHDLVTVHGAEATTRRTGPGPTPPVFTPDGRPASMFGHILPAWGLTAQDARRLPAADWAANLLTVAGWAPSARAWSAIVAAQNAEAAGANWAAATRRAIAAAGRVPTREPWDRRTDPGRHRAGLGYARRRRSPPGDGSHPR